MKRTPGQRDLRDLDLRNCNDGEETLRQRGKYSPRDAVKTLTPRPIDKGKQLEPTRTKTIICAKGNSSSDQSIPLPALSRSYSMINLQSARANPIRLRAGCDHFSEDEETKKFYHSIDPSIIFDDLELEFEPPRPTKQQTMRLRAGSPINCPPQSQQNSSYGRHCDQYSRPHNFSSFCPQGNTSGPHRGGSPSPTRRSSYDQYASIPARPPSTICPPMSPWSPPMMQTSTMSRPSSRPRYSRDTSSILYESPRRNQYAPQIPLNSTRYMELPGQPFKIPGLSRQAMQTQWLIPPGNMPSGFGQQSSLYPASTPQQSRWDPPPCPRNMDQPLSCPPKEEGPCPKERISLPCDGCEEDQEEGESFKAPPRCKPLDPEIAKKLCCDLPPFQIPRCIADEFFCTKRREQWEVLVKDQDCPGAIQSTTDGELNFNAVAYDIVFGGARLPQCLPPIDPITLIEAFFMRVSFERCQIRKLEKLTYEKENADDDDDRHQQPPRNDDCSLIEKCFKRKHQTELNKAIENLLKAEKGFDFENPDPELPSMNLVLDKTSFDLPGIPITIKGYTGTTKPRN
ncbi:uncharacterized protein [Eurosta solidaginis]|uniref:uncharacterized protein n=1 Tax=Eurosta solidaginis TaxID=178769 RepID=UPI003530998A